MSLTLNDLRVIVRDIHGNVIPNHPDEAVTLTDLIEILPTIGAVSVVFHETDHPDVKRVLAWQDTGTYLVLRIPEDTE